MRIVIDTSVLLQIISRRTDHCWLWQALLRKEVTLCVTTDILDEYHEKIVDIYFSQIFADYTLETIVLLPNLVKVEKYYFWGFPYKDEDDQKFVDCYVACGAAYLITEDKHFNELKKIPFPKVNVIRPDKFKIVFDAM